MSGRLISRRLCTRPPPRQNIRKPETEPSEQFQEAVCFVVAKKRNAPFKEEKHKTKQNKRKKECYAYKNLKQQILSTKTEKSISKMPTKTESPQIPLE